MTAELVCSALDPAWLDRRREGITATDIVTIAGLVTWDSPWALYHRKLGLLPEVEQSDRMRLGSWLQDAIWTQWDSQESDKSFGGGLYRNTARRWQLATPDTIVFPGETPTPIGQRPPSAVLECKTSATRLGWGDDGSDQVPASVRAQVLWQMDTLGVAVGHVAVVFLPSGEFRSYTISHLPYRNGCAYGPQDPCPIEVSCDLCLEIDGLRDLGFGFWSRILRREPPGLDGLEVTTDALRYLHPAPHDQIEIEDMWREQYDYAADHRAAAEKGYRWAQNKIREFMGDAHEATVDGRVVFRRTISKRAGYTVPPGEVDQLRRIGKDKRDD